MARRYRQRPKSRIAAEGNERLVLKDADGTSKQRGGVHEIVPLLSCGELGRVPIRLRAPIHNPKGAAGRGKSKSRLKSYPHLPARFTPHDTIVKTKRAGVRRPGAAGVARSFKHRVPRAGASGQKPLAMGGARAQPVPLARARIRYQPRGEA